MCPTIRRSPAFFTNCDQPNKPVPPQLLTSWGFKKNLLNPYMPEKKSKHPVSLDSHKVIAVKLKKLRAGRGESIDEAAKGARISKASLKVLESGEKDFRILTLWKICKYYGVNIGEIIE
jgi:DNA-binding Xre family transcriptional regulator